ncbi:MAG: hypothetical protein IJW61_04390 [Clostridia bacterium]|nr:hypothetical protein [Clostridia bacterium]
MRYKVIGWTSYDDKAYPNAKVSYAIKHAVVEDIKNNGYCFTGYHHQEYEGCVPVLNTGEKAVFSQRGFGDVMALANGMHGLYDYSLYAYTPDPNDKCYVLPTAEPRRELIQGKKELAEEFVISLDFETFAKADITCELELEDAEEYRLIEARDTVRLTCGDMDEKYWVLSVERKKDVSYSLEYKFKFRDCYSFEKDKDQIVRDYTSAKTKILLKLDYKF